MDLSGLRVSGRDMNEFPNSSKMSNSEDFHSLISPHS